ncbi:hypothetical protein [Acinetobacter haemolyticus]
MNTTLKAVTVHKRIQFAKDLDKLISGDYVLVPKEPTQKMLNAGHVVMNPVKGSDVHVYTNAKRRECYKAMIAAAQEASI